MFNYFNERIKKSAKVQYEREFSLSTLEYLPSIAEKRSNKLDEAIKKDEEEQNISSASIINAIKVILKEAAEERGIDTSNLKSFNNSNDTGKQNTSKANISLDANTKPEVTTLNIITNGNIYTTIKAFINYTMSNPNIRQIKLCCVSGPIETQKEIVTIFNQGYTDNPVDFKFYSNLSNSLISNTKNTETIVIDNTLLYKQLLKKNKNVEYKNFNSIDIFYDDEKFEEVLNALELFADINYINHHIYKIKSAYDIKIISNSQEKANRALIMTNAPHKYNESAQYSKIYFNQNPFKDDVY